MTADREVTFADRLFAVTARAQMLEDELLDKIREWLGKPTIRQCVRENLDIDSCFEDISHDYYDASFELHGAKPDLRMPVESLPKIWEAGFERFWINHTDGSETAYAKGGSPLGHHQEKPP